MLKLIHFTCPNKETITNCVWKQCMEQNRIMYKDYEIKLYDNQDIYNLIGEHYPMYLEKVKRIKVGAILADIFRYLILYLEGGIYSDMDCEPLKSCDDLISAHSDKKTILGYEFHKDYHSETKYFTSKWVYKNVGICQWFMISQPRQDIFLKMLLHCFEKIELLISLKMDQFDYHFKVINTCGPLGFTKIVLDNFTNDILILPCDYFCPGSGCTVPVTTNTIIKHHFTSSWKKKGGK